MLLAFRAVTRLQGQQARCYPCQSEALEEQQTARRHAVPWRRPEAQPPRGDDTAYLRLISLPTGTGSSLRERSDTHDMVSDHR